MQLSTDRWGDWLPLYISARRNVFKLTVHPFGVRRLAFDIVLVLVLDGLRGGMDGIHLRQAYGARGSIGLMGPICGVGSSGGNG
jgi:hypothetical protein